MCERAENRNPREALTRLAAAVAAEFGVEVVDLRLGRSSRRWHVRIDIDRAGPEGVSIDDCQRISRAIDPRIESAGLIPGSYVLEISSPGLDRPIRDADDVRRNTGRRVVVQARDESGSVRTWSGELLGLRDGAMELRVEDGSVQRVLMVDVVKAHQDIGF